MARAAALATVAVTLLAGCGGDSHEGHNMADTQATMPASQTIEVDMTEFAFAPATLSLPVGTVVLFRFHNRGSAKHEAVIGDEKFQAEHERMVMGGQHHMTEGGVDVDPGQSKDYRYAFKTAGTTIIGCHEPGHYDQGMKATITVGSPPPERPQGS